MIPRPYQVAAHDAVWQFLNEQAGNPVVVLPTGAGKSLVIAMMCQQCLEFGGRVIVLAHRKELLQQTAEKIQILMPGHKIGICSAGLGEKSTAEDIVCAGIQSAYRKAFGFGRRELVIIDEVHLVGSDSESMYGQFLHDIQVANPKLRRVGLTATAYRTGEGPVCGKNKLFQRVCFESMTGDMIRDGWLSPITNKPAVATVDTSCIKQRGGEFIASESQIAFDTSDNVSAACREIVEKCSDRKSVLVFSTGVAHAEHVATVLGEITRERVDVVTGDSFPMERAKSLADFKNQQLRWLINCDVLTTGFDAPCIDAIAVLRATMSPGLFAQIVGRGLRKSLGKSDCLILDFGGNIKRHGSLDDPNYGRSSGQSGGGEFEAVDANGRGRPCLNCGIDVSSRAMECPECGFIFPVNHETTADTTSAITGAQPPEVWRVEKVAWARHTKRNEPDAPATLRIDYECQPVDEPSGGNMPKHISEWVCIEHEGYARTKACGWWAEHSITECPDSIDEALDLLDRGALRMPSQITTDKDGRWYRIKSVEFVDEKPEEWLDELPVEEMLVNEFGDDVPF